MTHLLLLWILTLTATFNPSVCLGPNLEGVQGYEVVRPIRLHTLQKRHTESSRPESLKYALTVGGEDMEIHLEKNRELLTKDYSETHYREDGTRVDTIPEDIDHCYYHGRIMNDSESMASISTCDGLRGYFQTAAQRYLIEPLSGGDDGDHAVLKYEDQNSTPAVCGVTNTTWDSGVEPPTGRTRSRASGPSVLQQEKYIELLLVADNREFIKMKKDLLELRKRIFEIVNFVNMVYKPLNTFIALIGLEVWTDADKIVVTAPAGATLDAFTKWRNGEQAKSIRNDNAHLISGIDFEGATVGLAFIGTLCSAHATGVIQDHNPRAMAVGATLAHEMGHNLGMNHDDSSACSCSADSCIMAPALSYDIPKTFSSCSSGNYEQFLLSRNTECMQNKPPFNEVLSTPVCGNGFLERGEECDCGSLGECTNPCCNATSCTLTKGSQCADGECCEDCKILPSSRECRRKNDDCDLAEYCNGKSATCPEDVFTVNGLPCDEGQGYCNNGRCPKRADQCVKMYGPSAEVASQYCYDQNTRGLYYAYCKRPSDAQHSPCQARDVLCGKLFCTNGNDSPNYGQLVKFGNCKATFYQDYLSDFGQVDSGTKCGEEKVCSQNECVDLQTAYRVTNCSSRCNGHAVCNHRKECQCVPGWLPPNCDQKDDSFKLSNEAVTAIAVTITLLVLAALAIGAGFLWKRRQSPSLPNARTVQKTHAVDNNAFNPKRIPVPSKGEITPQIKRPVVRPPPPPPAGKKPPPSVPNFMAARQALRPPPRA